MFKAEKYCFFFSGGQVFKTWDAGTVWAIYCTVCMNPCMANLQLHQFLLPQPTEQEQGKLDLADVQNHLCIYGCVAFSCNAAVDCSAPKFPNSQAQCDELPSEEITVSMPSLLPVVASATTQRSSVNPCHQSPKHFNALVTMVTSEYVCSILSIGKNMRAQKKRKWVAIKRSTWPSQSFKGSSCFIMILPGDSRFLNQAAAKAIRCAHCNPQMSRDWSVHQVLLRSQKGGGMVLLRKHDLYSIMYDFKPKLFRSSKRLNVFFCSTPVTAFKAAHVNLSS